MSPTRRSGHGPRSWLAFLLSASATLSAVSAAALEPRQTQPARPTGGFQVSGPGLAEWVTVSRSSLASTVTPTTTVDARGAAGIISGFPGIVTSAPVMSSNGEASFLRCHNLDGTFAPFCTPDETSILQTGTTYISKLHLSFACSLKAQTVAAWDLVWCP